MKILVLNLYFGKKPDYFDFFIHTCGVNPAIDFLFLVDFEVDFELPANVKIVRTFFVDVVEKFQSFFDFPLALDSPYKLTDFQPAYGELLAEYTAGYDWWGHCDFDMAFGDLTPVVEAIELNRYVKLFRRGHLTLYLNRSDINSMYRQGVGNLDYRDIFATRGFFNFDETNGIDKIFSDLDMPVYRQEIIADIRTTSPYLFMTAHANRWGQYFVWDNGKLFCVDGENGKKEYIYIHFQKRKLGEYYSLSNLQSNKFLINQFGIFDFGGLIGVLSYFPNLGHLKRFFWPRIVRRVKGKFKVE